MPLEAIPNDVRARLVGINKQIADANLNFGQSRISSWPGYPKPGTYPRQALFDIECNWEAQFKYTVNNVETVRDAFTIELKYHLYGSVDEGKIISGMPITIPYDMEGLPAPVGKEDKTPNVKQRAEMALARGSTQLRMLLGISEDEFKQRAAAGSMVAILEAVGQKMAAASANGLPLCGRVNFQIREYSYTDKQGQKKEGLDGTDTIVEVTSATADALKAAATAPPTTPI